MTTGTQAKTDRAKLRKDHPDSWIGVEPGDFITGKVVDVTEAWSDVREDGSWYPLLTIKVEEATGYPQEVTELKLHGFGAVLYGEILRHQPEVGETVTVTYRGTSDREPPKGRNAPELYSVRVHNRADQGSRAYARIQQSQPGSGRVAGAPVDQGRGPEDPGDFPPS